MQENWYWNGDTLVHKCLSDTQKMRQLCNKKLAQKLFDRFWEVKGVCEITARKQAYYVSVGHLAWKNMSKLPWYFAN